MRTIGKRALAIAYRTSNVYSFDRYGAIQWTAIAVMLIRYRGYTDQEVEAILRSKWMRYAGDASGRKHPILDDVIRYLDNPNNGCTQEEVDKLVSQTNF